MSYLPEFQEVLTKVENAHTEGGNALAQHVFIDECKKLDSWIRINSLYRVRPKTPTPGEKARMVFFSANRIQTDFWKTRKNRDLVLKSRQQGVTTLAQLIALDMCLFQEGTQTAIIAHRKDNVQVIFKSIKSIFNAFKQDWGHLYPVTSKYDNVNELSVNETGSSFRVAMETKGMALDFLHISEAAFVEDNRITESVESVPFSGMVILESTPDTASGLFYEIFDKAERGYESFYKIHFYPWWWQYPEPEDFKYLQVDKKLVLSDTETALMAQHEEITEQHILWRRLKITECGSESEFLRQFPEDARSCFLSGESCVFSTDVLKSLSKHERPANFSGILEMS